MRLVIIYDMHEIVFIKENGTKNRVFILFCNKTEDIQPLKSIRTPCFRLSALLFTCIAVHRVPAGDTASI